MEDGDGRQWWRTSIGGEGGLILRTSVGGEELDDDNLGNSQVWGYCILIA